MYKIILALMTLLITISCQNQPKKQQPQEDRVTVAKAEKESMIKSKLASKNLSPDNLNILFVAYKNTDKLELYAKAQTDDYYALLQTYAICKRSGVLGPKKAEGDKQVPEGFYYIDRFNPQSLYYLSLGLNYPNELDKSLGYTGSDIFIHGKCETVGCLPMTDELIKEIYLYALLAQESGQQQIPVYIFPFEMTNENIENFKSETDETTLAFWKNLQEGYALFQKNSKALHYSVQNGRYVFD
ncbi:L,D-transpeptidase family protein [Sphingobacterium yanglingense]|uniref:L,D-transpeptidase-like protein n=1 Tax=Sphingobacterium yanglingense TaxID=1437280 RepID=A0A4R6WM21_9SPHI|nr:L,D-transpeptidase family protein [Sphingobacterium yanglingense]TDQ77061.1 L,D-transpeptidase-like protein [Sphingobacterium yanglingense]